MPTKYKLIDATTEEQDAFMKDFNEMLNKHSLYFEPIPTYVRENVNSPFEIKCQIFLQKKIEIVEVEKDSIPSPFVATSTPIEEVKTDESTKATS